MTTAILQLAPAAAEIIVAGGFLTHAADRIAQVTGFGPAASGRLHARASRSR